MTYTSVAHDSKEYEKYKVNWYTLIHFNTAWCIS